MNSVPGHRKTAVVTFIALFAVYAATAAPDVTYWDSGEFLAAVHSLGIPHPPGTPLYVIAANVWAHIFSPLLGFARAVNLFSAACAAAGCAVIANLFSRWLRDPVAGFAAAVCAGATSSLWLSATETEVYAPSFLVAMLLVWIANEFRETGNTRYLVLLAYVTGLGWALHLTALIALPPALVLIASEWGSVLRTMRSRRLIAALIFVSLAGMSVVAFMYIRAKHDPAINQGNPSTIAAISDVIARRQYDVAGVWPRRAPLYLQLGNIFEWADWQFALGLNSAQPPSPLRTTVTIFFAILGVLGSVWHRRTHLISWRAMMALLVVASVGVVVYLNLKAGPSYGEGFLGKGSAHEARERDYFFLLAWVSWGAWAGLGAMLSMRRVAANGIAMPLGLVVASAPLLMNWSAVDRSHPPRSNEARDFAGQILKSADQRAVVLARGDNDTYPVWYEREVNGIRPDIATVTIPMLPTEWYRAELARRYGLLDEITVREWKGTEATLRVICERAGRQSRPVVGPINISGWTLKPAC